MMNNINYLKDNERITENCRWLASTAKFYHATASQANEVVKEIFGAFRLARASLSFTSPKLPHV